MGHVERDVAERVVIDIIKGRGLTRVLDIGGNAVRHAKYRNYIEPT